MEVQNTEETANEEPAADKDELAQELEELRDMFQQELDKATEEAENPQELIQELEEITAENDADDFPPTTEYGCLRLHFIYEIGRNYGSGKPCCIDGAERGVCPDVCTTGELVSGDGGVNHE